jgi:hypothetical protein
MTSKKSKMQNTSSANIDKTTHEDISNIPTMIRKLAGLKPAKFDKAVVPIRKYLEQFDEGGKLSKLMLTDNVTHHLADGVYVRELELPVGSVVLSRVHKRALVNIISKGYVIVVDSNGTNQYTAGSTFVSKAGTQRLVYALEDTIWNTAHVTDKTQPDELVEDLTFDNYEEFISYSNTLTHQELK